MVLNINLVPNNLRKLFQNVDTNLISLSNTIVLGTHMKSYDFSNIKLTQLISIGVVLNWNNICRLG